MSTLRNSIISNYAGQVWATGMGIAFLPVYIHFLGMEAFGLVGLMLSIQSISQLFDFGIGGAANREISRRVHDSALIDSVRDLVRSSEIAIWTLATLVGIGIWICSGLVVDHWLHLQSLRPDSARNAVAIMGLAIALLWPSAFYANCLSGLERQPILNIINAAFATLRYAGVVPILAWISPSPIAFFGWYALTGAFQSLIEAVVTWRQLPCGHGTARWSSAELIQTKRFASGLFLIGSLALGVAQLDRLTIASLRPLSELGYYTLALGVAAGLGRMVQPMFNAIYPRFSRLIARGDQVSLRTLYHLASQYLAVLIAAIAAILIVFPRDILFLWTGNHVIAAQAAMPLALLAAGYALNGLMNIPYALQLADGWTHLAAMLNGISLLAGIPVCVLAVMHYGITGAASVWLLTNAAAMLVCVPIMHRKLLRGEMFRWYIHDNLPPLMIAAVAAVVLHNLLPPISRTITGYCIFASACAITLSASALASRPVRHSLRGVLARYAG